MIILDANKGTISGYAVLFDDLSLDGVGFMPGAFARSLRDHTERSVKLPLLFCHDPRDPLGVVDNIYEDAKGLRVRGHLILATTRGREMFELVKERSVSGFSVGIANIQWDEARDRVKDCDLGEISLVPTPRLPQSRIASFSEQYDHRVGNLWRDSWKHQLGGET